jgi:hypothetical protein
MALYSILSSQVWLFCRSTYPSDCLCSIISADYQTPQLVGNVHRSLVVHNEQLPKQISHYSKDYLGFVASKVHLI